MVYINQNERYKYDSFIFGNSRSRVYYEEEWKKYIPKGSSVFHFDDSSGSIKGVYSKLKYIDEHNGMLKNALFVIDAELLGNTEATGRLYRTAPVLENYRNLIPFLYEHLDAFTNFTFIYALIDFSITHKYKDYMLNYMLDREIEWRDISNELRKDQVENEILKGEYYTDKRMQVFENVQFPDSLSPSVISVDGKKYLQQIAKILKKHNTSYKIVISPLYNQVKLNKADWCFLKNTFSKNCVFDFSGVNKWNCDFHNYYEHSHYRPCVANDVLNIIYR